MIVTQSETLDPEFLVSASKAEESLDGSVSLLIFIAEEMQHLLTSLII